jgi:DNA-3-methyladenine glycosylase
MRTILGKQFFTGEALAIAPALLGKYLVRKTREREIALIITEVEAYDGCEDRASHAYRGRTVRNEVMFREGGCWYVYLIYGVHWMLNIVVAKKDYPAAILIRGGLVQARGSRKPDARPVESLQPLASGRIICGPGKLTGFLKIDKEINGRAAVRASGLWIEDRGVVIKSSHIKKTPRIGVDYAGRRWASKPWRFVIDPRSAGWSLCNIKN